MLSFYYTRLYRNLTGCDSGAAGFSTGILRRRFFALRTSDRSAAAIPHHALAANMA
jgi:hypothetical protein